MKASEARYRVTATLLQAARPLGLAALAEQSGVVGDQLSNALGQLESEHHVVSVQPGDGDELRYCWAAVVETELRRSATEAQRGAGRAVTGAAVGSRGQWSDVASGDAPTSPGPGAALDGAAPASTRPNLLAEAARRFNQYVVAEYRPPQTKSWLVLLQCSVRRPFSTSPSHASMRRAIATATGFDPATDFERCPVHVVVLASYVGPVPYELEGVPPANLRANGVKHMSPQEYADSHPVLVERVAGYLAAHSSHYRSAAAFAGGRYGDILSEAAARAGVEVALLPRGDGPRVLRLGTSTARKYWEKHWIQLYLQVHQWLDPGQRLAADRRLEALDVVWEPGAGQPSAKRLCGRTPP